jgi:hypothetical protein
MHTLCNVCVQWQSKRVYEILRLKYSTSKSQMTEYKKYICERLRKPHTVSVGALQLCVRHAHEHAEE